MQNIYTANISKICSKICSKNNNLPLISAALTLFSGVVCAYFFCVYTIFHKACYTFNLFNVCIQQLGAKNHSILLCVIFIFWQLCTLKKNNQHFWTAFKSINCACEKHLHNVNNHAARAATETGRNQSLIISEKVENSCKKRDYRWLTFCKRQAGNNNKYSIIVY